MDQRQKDHSNFLQSQVAYIIQLLHMQGAFAPSGQAVPSSMPGVIPQYVFHQVPLHASSWTSPPGLFPQTFSQHADQEQAQQDTGHTSQPNTESCPEMVSVSAQWEPLDIESTTIAKVHILVEAATEPDISFGVGYHSAGNSASKG